MNRELFCLFTSGIVVVLSSVVWDPTDVIVRQGDNLNLTCTITELGFFDVLRIELQTNQGSSFAVADSRELKSPFSKIGRYSVEYDYITRRNKGMLTIHYRGIQGEDAGTLLCYNLNNKDDVAKVKIHVEVPATKIFFMSIFADGSQKPLQTGSLQLREKEENGLVCIVVVVGSLSPTIMKILVDGEDKTHFFTASEESRTMESQDGFESLYSESRLVYVTMNPERDFHQKNLSCVAKRDGFEDAIASTMLSIEYGPVLVCDKYEHFVKLGDRLVIQCIIASNPGSTIQWSSDTLNAQGLIDDLNVKFSETVIDPDQTSLQLVIEKVEMPHFGSYYLSAHNDISSQEITVFVRRASSKDDVLLATGKDKYTQLLLMQHQMEPAMLQMMQSANAAFNLHLPCFRLILLALFVWVFRHVA